MKIEQESYNMEQGPDGDEVLAYNQGGNLEIVSLEEALAREMFIVDDDNIEIEEAE